MSSGTTKIPAGLELVYDLEKANVENALDAFVLSLHWSIIRTGLRQRSPTNSSEFTERLPSDWPQHQQPGPTRTLTQTYLDPHNARFRYELKVIELTSNDLVAVTFFRSPNNGAGGETSGSAGSGSAGRSEGQGGAAGHGGGKGGSGGGQGGAGGHGGAGGQGGGQGQSAAASANRPASDKSSGAEKNSAASTFQIASFIRTAAFQEGSQRESARDVFEHADLLETQLYESIMEPLGLRVMGQPPVQGPYDDATKSKEKANSQQQQQNPLADDRFHRQDIGRRPSPVGPGFPGGFGPLFVPPAGGLGGLGRSDLDPLGGLGMGNILDPRGFRTPRGGMPGLFPGSIPPGARFDPFGPPNPTRPDGGTGSFAMPNPDHERPPSSDYDDMFM